MANVTTALAGIPNLLTFVESGLIQLPEFQRNYVWSKTKQKELVDSILHAHPVGTFLEVELNQEEPLFAWSPLMDVTVPEDKQYVEIPLPEGKSTPTTLLLDGQQRLTTIAHIFGGLGSRSWFLDTQKLENYWVSEESPTEGPGLEEWIEGIDFSDYVSDLQKKDDPIALFGHSARRLTLEIFSNQDLFNHTINDKLTKTTTIVVELKSKIKFHKQLKIGTPKEELETLTEKFEKQHQFLQILQRILTPVFSVEIPIVTVPVGMSVAGVCKIFTTINQTGQKLGSFDLIVASMYKFGIRLKNQWEDTLSINPKCKIIDGPESDKKWILMTLALINDKNPNPTKLATTFAANDFADNKLQTAASKFEEILSFLDLHFGTSILEQGSKLISFKRALPPMAAAVNHCAENSKETPEQRVIWQNKLKCYYIASSITNRFSTSSGALQLADYNELALWLTTNTFEENMPLWLTNFESVSHLKLFNSAPTAAVNKFLLGILNQNSPVDIHTNQPTSFSHTDQNPEKHHIFPTAYLNGLIDPGNLMDEKELNSHRTNTYKSDSMLNRMIISQETNNQVISDSAPSEYLQSLVDNGLHVNTLKDRLSRAYVNEQAYNHLMEDNYHGFIQTRCQHLLQVINGMASMNLLEFIEADPDENEEPAQNEANLEEQTIEFIGQLGDEASE